MVTSRTLLIFTFLFQTTFLWAYNPETKQDNGTIELSLQQAREFALEHSIAMKTAQADVSIANFGIREIIATGLPQISADVGYQYFLDIPVSLIPAEFFGGEEGEFQEIQFGTEHNITASATWNQMIFDGGYIVGLRAARIYRDISTRNMQRTELEVQNIVTETYLLGLVARENLDIVRQNLENMEKTLFETEQVLNAGFTDPINVDQLKLTVANMKNAISNLERQHQLTSDMLKFQIGLDMDTQVVLTDSLQGLFRQLSLQATSTDLFDPTTHIDFMAMESAEDFSRMVMLRERSAYLPTLTASFTRQEMAMRNQFNFFDSEHPWFPTSLISVNLNIPIFSSGLRSSRIKQARLEWEKSKMQTWEVSQGLVLQMNRARATFSTALEQYENEQENLELAKRILERTTIMQREGLASSLELTQANEQLLTTQSNYLNALFELLNAQNALSRARGSY